MGKPAAKQGDTVVAIDTHVLMVSAPGGAVPTPTPMPFQGALVDALSKSVLVEDLPAAIVGSGAQNQPPHIPAAGPFQSPPSNKAKIDAGSGTVFIEDEPVARAGDTAMTCNDPADAPKGKIVCGGTVLVGD